MEPLFPFQEIGAQWLTTKKYALLADEMRLGKSAQSIAACNTALSLGLVTTPILVLCPAVARLNWIREWQKFSPSEKTYFAVLRGSEIESANGCDVVVCSYDLLLDNAVNSWMLSRDWGVLILDEVHYLKEARAARSKKVFGKAGLVHRAQRVWALSGTPTPNNNAELWILLFVFGITRLSYEDFVARYCETVEIPIPTPRGGTLYRTAVTGGKNIRELRDLLAPHLLRRKREEVLKDLPKINVSHVAVEQAPVDIARWWKSVMLGNDTEEQIRALIQREQAAIDALVQVGGEGSTCVDMLPSMMASVKTCRRYVGLSKVPAIVAILTEELRAKAYDKIVLFAWHRDVMVALEEGLKEFFPLKVYGGTPPEKKDLHLRKFQTQAKFRVFIGQIAACGTAIELSAAHEVAFVESSWVPSDNAQAAMRVHNIVQTQPVNVRFFGAADTSDEKIQMVLRRKTRDILALFDTPSKESLFS